MHWPRVCPLVTSGSVVSPEGADGGHRGHPGWGRGLHHRVPGPRHPGPPPPVPAPGGRTAGHHLCQLGAVQLRRLEENILISIKNVSFLLAVCWTQITNIYSFTTICSVPGELLMIFIASYTLHLDWKIFPPYLNLVETIYRVKMRLGVTQILWAGNFQLLLSLSFLSFYVTEPGNKNTLNFTFSELQEEINTEEGVFQWKLSLF